MINDIYQYSGAIHIHTKNSDGSGNIDEISKAAKQAGLDWIIITDHNYIDKTEGIYNGVYVINGEEISPSDKNHYLAFGIKNVILPDDNPQNYIDEVRNQGGFGFAAHPDESLTRKNNFSPIRWLDKNIIPDGIEIWNWLSCWADNLDDSNIFGLIYSFLFKNFIPNKPKQETIEWWDELNNQSDKIIPAIGGLDVHALKIKKYIIPVTVFPYKFSFETITNIIQLKTELSKDFYTAKHQILNALKNGNNVILNRKISKDIPLINVQNKFEKVYVGDTIVFGDDYETLLNITLSRKSLVKIIKNGEEVYKITSDKISYPIKETGKYRVVIGKSEYLYSNPICIIKN